MSNIENDIQSNYLSISHHKDEHLKFSWNFKEKQRKSQTNFHILLFLGDYSDSFSLFLSAYYKSMRSGDIMGLLCKSHKAERGYQIDWNEKTNIQRTSEIGVTKKWKTIADFDEPFNHILNSIANKRKGLCFVNIISKQEIIQKQIQNLEKIVLEKRRQERLSNTSIVTLFSGKGIEPILHGNSGFNLFPYHQGNEKQEIQVFENYQKSLSLACVKVSFEIRVRENLKCDPLDWDVVDFGIFQKYFYAVPTLKFTEYLFFLSITGLKMLKTPAKVRLEITYCDGKKWNCESDFDISVDLRKLLSQTLTTKALPEVSVQLHRQESFLTNYMDKNIYFCVQNNSKDEEQ